MIVTAFSVLVVTLVSATSIDQTQIESYGDGSRIKKYRIPVTGRDPITIIEAENPNEATSTKWIDITLSKPNHKSAVKLKQTLSDVFYDPTSETPRCYGPSCQAGFVDDEGPQGNLGEYLKNYEEKVTDFRDFSSDRLQAISALASKLKNENIKSDRYYAQPNPSGWDSEEDEGGKVHTAWNKLQVKNHKHPYDDKDGWVTLEPVAWSTSKISKWKPNIKKQKPLGLWNDDEPLTDDDNYFQMTETPFDYPKKKPSFGRPTFINNKLQVSASNDWGTEIPKPFWNKPQATATATYPMSWNSDDSRRPYKPPCDNNEHSHTDDTVYYGLSDSVVTDTRPSRFPYEYQALKKPLKRPTQVLYAGEQDSDTDRISQSNFGNGQWILLSTTKGYRNKKRQRSLFDQSDESRSDSPLTMTSHQAVALTVLPADEHEKNMTTSHGGLLEVERSFKSVEESKQDMDKNNEYRPDLNGAQSEQRPYVSKVMKRKILSNSGPDSSAVLAAVGAGMVPATMAMVVPMMIGKRRKRDLSWSNLQPFYNNIRRY